MSRIEVKYDRNHGPNRHVTESRWIDPETGRIYHAEVGGRMALPIQYIRESDLVWKSPEGHLVHVVGHGRVLDSKSVRTALDTQVGGNHYKGMKIQPVEFIVANEIPYREANAIKYLCRHKSKNGLQDLKKAAHYVQMLIEEAEAADVAN